MKAYGYDCAYCGMAAQDMDHVVPRIYASVVRDKRGDHTRSQEDCVPSCHECNQLLGASMYLTVATRAQYVANALLFRYKQILNSPDWDEEDYEELSGRLLKEVKAKQKKKKVTLARIAYAESIAELHDLSIENVWSNQNKFIKR